MPGSRRCRWRDARLDGLTAWGWAGTPGRSRSCWQMLAFGGGCCTNQSDNRAVNWSWDNSGRIGRERRLQWDETEKGDGISPHRPTGARAATYRAFAQHPRREAQVGRSVKTRGPRPEQARDQQRGWLLLAEGKRERLGPAFRALQDGRPEVKRGASGVESESLRDTAAMRPHRGLMRHRRESFSTGATATDSPLDGATRRAR